MTDLMKSRVSRNLPVISMLPLDVLLPFMLLLTLFITSTKNKGQIKWEWGRKDSHTNWHLDLDKREVVGWQRPWKETTGSSFPQNIKKGKSCSLTQFSVKENEVSSLKVMMMLSFTLRRFRVSFKERQEKVSISKSRPFQNEGWVYVGYIEKGLGSCICSLCMAFAVQGHFVTEILFTQTINL